MRLKRDKDRAKNNLWYYRYQSPPIPLSRYLNLTERQRVDYHDLLVKSKQGVEVYAYCLMDNHFHLLLKQLDEGGVSRYLANIQNSFTKFFNNKHKRKGALFLNQFKAVRIETDEQLVHVSRYIHLNPLTGYLMRDMDELFQYSYTSLPEYLSGTTGSYSISNPQEILAFFKNAEDYEKFVRDQVEYQRNLAKIKHLMFELEEGE